MPILFFITIKHLTFSQFCFIEIEAIEYSMFINNKTGFEALKEIQLKKEIMCKCTKEVYIAKDNT